MAIKIHLGHMKLVLKLGQSCKVRNCIIAIQVDLQKGLNIL
ncbi:MAG: hypothetical protein K0R92_3383 [Lachnospiraceae bacterium]|nr:hypothetical protein [Lachnospiraceae bacterium]